MMKYWIILLTALFSAGQAFTAPAGNGYRTESSATAVDCVECRGGGVTPNEAMIRFLRDMKKITNESTGRTDGVDPNEVMAKFLKDMKRIANEKKPQVVIEVAGPNMSVSIAPIIQNPRVYSPACRAFAADGKYGSLGQAVIQEVHRPENRALYDGSSDLHNNYCPNYRNMTNAEKDGLWVLFTAGWSEQESSCDSRATKRCENGTCAGIIQLHRNAENTYNGDKHLCQRGSSQRADTSLRCGLSMLNNSIEKGRNLFSANSHFGTLLPNGSQGSGLIINSIKRYAPCGYSAAANSGAKRNSSKRVAQN